MDLIYLQTPFTIGTVSRLMSKHKISFGALLHKILMHLLEGAMSSYSESCRKLFLTNLYINAVSSGLGVDYIAEHADVLRMQKKKGTQNILRASALSFLSGLECRCH